MVSEARLQEKLGRIAFKLTADHALQEDLVQEASIHLWLRQKQCPGRTESWYLQSCRFFLQNHLRNGRSVDAAKRSTGSCLFEALEQGSENGSEQAPDCDEVVALVSAREIISSLAKCLSPAERQVLFWLAEGFRVREISVRLKVSHTSVIRHRRRIAVLATMLGIEAPSKKSRQGRFPI